MNHDTPLSPRPLQQLASGSRRLLTTAQLRARGVAAAETTAHCRPGGPWQQILPGVVLLHPGPPTGEERLHAVLLYAGRERAGGVPSQPGPRTAAGHGEAVITGLAALTLHGFTSAPPLPDLETVDVLVPRARRLRSTGCARILRTSDLPVPELLTVPQALDPVRAQGALVPVAPVARALADAVAELADPAAVRRLLTEAVRGGHCEPAAVVRELKEAHLLSRPHMVDAVESLLAEGRAIAEDRLYRMVRDYGLPDPVWNVGLRLPGGPDLGGVDAYWPEHAVAVDLDTRAGRHGHASCGEAGAPECPRKREHLERLGITVVQLSAKKLRDAPEHQAIVVRTALMAAADREPAAYVVVLPRP
ncbi:hypothetical protein TU94_11420 [Streptomyces cyaneogriseus subsp. noncyanogenus]|uniref:DUF559 domain-containing protein n=1 Tax=Streptomyces cyaneogriseus subsp. noncyanogenus TaxID=477245 RepID=A0A0C5GCU0_9ACTN|nr:hypothetical protein [Streptomyces cyaneogriseus]AJP02026.1 hypothetical protein TU94_11420 [Streptomyces cyaneogriseus subsp. noncyanogenus]